MTPQLPNKLEPLKTEIDRGWTDPIDYEPTNRDLTGAVNNLIASHNELIDFVAFSVRFIEELHNPSSAKHRNVYVLDKGAPHWRPHTEPAENCWCYQDEQSEFKQATKDLLNLGESTASDQQHHKDIKDGK